MRNAEEVLYGRGGSADAASVEAGPVKEEEPPRGVRFRGARGRLGGRRTGIGPEVAAVGLEVEDSASVPVGSNGFEGGAWIVATTLGGKRIGIGPRAAGRLEADDDDEPDHESIEFDAVAWTVAAALRLELISGVAAAVAVADCAAAGPPLGTFEDPDGGGGGLGRAVFANVSPGI
jgi:hypothetical protein